MSFDEWPLHDAVIYDICVDWESHTCRIKAAVFLQRGAAAVRCVLSWTGVRSVRLSMEEPWGPSVFVNSKSRKGRVFRIEMQTGDDILIAADSCAMMVSSAEPSGDN